jgi:hypothetical protein
VALSSCRCLFVRRSWCAAKLDKEGGQPDETRLARCPVCLVLRVERGYFGRGCLVLCLALGAKDVEDVFLLPRAYLIRAATSNCRRAVGRWCLCAVQCA